MKLRVVKKRFFTWLPMSLILLGIFLLMISFGPLIRDEVWFYFKEMKEQEFVLVANEDLANKGDTVRDSIFARYLSSKPIRIEPVSKDFGLVIERIGVNVPVVKDVSVTDEVAYSEALKYGVAHSLTSGYPSRKPGNVYIFAHASLNFWKLGEYATVFNLLRKLDPGDKVHVFYEGDAYVYSVINIEKVKGWDTYPLTRPVIEPLLTLQTCDPPGTTLNRLVVTAKLADFIAGNPDDE
ncbi:class E sortase [Patescibacteria group bacterium]|nr:class E sortase [Patescibacteria group bacterium]